MRAPGPRSLIRELIIPHSQLHYGPIVLSCVARLDETNGVMHKGRAGPCPTLHNYESDSNGPRVRVFNIEQVILLAARISSEKLKINTVYLEV